MDETSQAQNISEDIFKLLVLVSQNFNKPLEENFRGTFTTVQLYTLILLRSRGQMTMTELAEQMHMPKQQMSKVVARLEEEGHICRHHDEHDHRVIYADISEEASAYISLRREAFAKHMDNMLEQMSESDREDFITSVHTLGRVLKNTGHKKQ